MRDAGSATSDALVQHLSGLSVGSWRDLDFNWGARFHEYFTEDGIFDFAGDQSRGRSAIRDRFVARRESGDRSSLHMVSNFSIVSHGRDGATAEQQVKLAYYVCVFGADGPAPLEVALPTLAGTLADDYVQVGDRWLIKLRRFSPVFFDPNDRVGRRANGDVR